jgi:predicted HicB family RNase H-like nuclease
MAQNYIIKAIPQDLHKFLKIESIKRDMSLNALVIEILEAYKKEREGKK